MCLGIYFILLAITVAVTGLEVSILLMADTVNFLIAQVHFKVEAHSMPDSLVRLMLD
jgi:hypothetical protein